MNERLQKRFVAALGLVRHARERGLYPYGQPVDGCIGATARYNGRSCIMLASNDYLGMAGDVRVRDAAIRAVSAFGTGQGGAPLICGATRLHAQLEQRLAEFLEKESVLLFPSGYQANLGCLSAVASRDDRILMDAGCHASSFDGAKLSGAEVQVFPHNNVDELRRLLANQPGRITFVMVDGVYSMSGDLAPLDRIVQAAHEFSAFVVVDDAHGFGLLGDGGRGTPEQRSCLRDVDLLIGSMSKCLGTTGGFAAGDETLIDFLRHRARAGLFSAAIPPANVGAAIAAIEIVQSEPWRRERVLRLAADFRRGLAQSGVPVCGDGAAIASISVNHPVRAAEWAKTLRTKGIIAIPVFPPAVPIGSSVIRCHVTAGHDDESMRYVVDAFAALQRDGDTEDARERPNESPAHVLQH